MIHTRLHFLVVPLLTLFCLPSLAMAATIFNTPTEQYAVYELVDDLPTAYSAYGRLQDEPHTYQFTLSATTTIKVALFSVDETDANPLFSTILVLDQGNQGVREVKRMRAAEMEWQLYQDPRTKMLYQQADTYTLDIAPGTYRVEVSTPDNAGAYRLDVVGEGSETVGFFTEVREIRAIQVFHGYGWWNLIRTSAVQTPLLFLVVAIGMYLSWRYARRRKLI